MSSTKVKEYFKYREVVKKLLLTAGLWPLEKPNVFYRALPYVEIFITFLMASIIFSFVQRHTDNINLIIRGLSIMTSFLTLALKMTCLLLYRKDIYELHELLDLYITEFLTDIDAAKFIFKNVTKFRRLTVYFVILVFYSCSCWVMIPLYHNIQNSIHDGTGKNVLIYPGGYPYVVPSTGSIFILHFIFETIASILLGTITTGVDSLFTFYVYQIICQLREISQCVSDVNESNNDGFIIRKCIIQYQNLMRCRDIIEKIFGPMILWIMGTNAVILCTVMFQISHSKNLSKGRIVLLITYISLKVIQTFMYSWSGSQLTEESENYGTAVYCSKWYGNKRFMSSVIIMIMQRPLILTACNFSVVSLNIFVAILNTTMSYFFLLQALEEST